MANDIKKFCETDTGTNLLSTANYDVDAQRTIGNQPGIARLQLVNKVLRQTSWVTKVFCDYLIQQTGGDVTDDSNDSVLLAKMTSTFGTGIPVGGIVNLSLPQVPTGYLKCNGAAISRTTYSTLFQKLVTDQGYTLQTFTVTIATPAVVTKTAHGFTGGERLRLSTTGTLPTGLNNSTDYFVKYIDANTFNLQDMSGVLAGTLINTSGTQSGTHSYLRSMWGLGDGSTTFNVPDLRGVFARAWDDGRGLDANRAIATLQMDAFQGHKHRIDIDWNSSGIGSAQRIALYAQASGSSTWFADTINANASNGTPRVASETRPLNASLMPVIKF